MTDAAQLLITGNASLTPANPTMAADGLGARGLAGRGDSSRPFASVLQARLQTPANPAQNSATGAAPGEAYALADQASTGQPLALHGKDLPLEVSGLDGMVNGALPLALDAQAMLALFMSEAVPADGAAAQALSTAPVEAAELDPADTDLLLGNTLPGSVLKLLGNGLAFTGAAQSSPAALSLAADNRNQTLHGGAGLDAQRLAALQAALQAMGTAGAAGDDADPLGATELARPLSQGGAVADLAARFAALHAARQVTTNEADNAGLTRQLLAMAGMSGDRPTLAGRQGVISTLQRHSSALLDILPAQPPTTSLSGEESAPSGLGLHASRAASTPTLPLLQVNTPVGTPSWSHDMAQRVTWLANTQIREAQIQLNPRHLGPVEVKISFGQDQQMNVTFTAAHPVTREALDAALPRLREMFEQQGMLLADANVSRDSLMQRQRQDQGEGAGHAHDGRGAAAVAMAGLHADDADLQPPMPRAIGLIDAYV